ncbi:hypothetical protein C0J52_18863 [Blattella germanica]|nr:hypothetical protein C0J52_18863 [Blattella germanica]
MEGYISSIVLDCFLKDYIGKLKFTWKLGQMYWKNVGKWRNFQGSLRIFILRTEETLPFTGERKKNDSNMDLKAMGVKPEFVTLYMWVRNLEWLCVIEYLICCGMKSEISICLSERGKLWMVAM